MNQKRLSYILLTISICFFAFCIYFIMDYVKATMSDHWVLEESVQSSMGESIKDEEIDQLILKYAADPTIKSILERMEASPEEDYEYVKEKLGVDSVGAIRGVVTTDIGCSIVTLDEEQIIRYQWTNQIVNGSIQLIIKDIHGKIVFENENANTSVQGEIDLPAGDYFVYINWSVNEDMSYKLYMTEK